MTNSSLSADTQARMAFEANKKTAGMAYLLCIITGCVGGHRFYLGRTKSAMVQLCLAVIGILLVSDFGLLLWLLVGLPDPDLGLLFIIGSAMIAALIVWLLVDLFTIGGVVAKHNLRLMHRLNASSEPKAA